MLPINHSILLKVNLGRKKTEEELINLKNSLNKPETKEKMSKAHKGIKFSDEARNNMKIVQNKPEVKAKNSASVKLAYQNPEVKARLIEAMNKPEVSAKIAKANSERIILDKSREKISAAGKMRPLVKDYRHILSRDEILALRKEIFGI